MTNRLWLGFLVSVPLVYACFVYVVGFGWIALPIHFGRVMFPAAVLVLWIPLVPFLFRTQPVRREDYLLASVFFLFTSALGFANLNDIGQTFGVDRSIFTSPVAGFFSLLLVIGGVFALVAPPSDVSFFRRVALAIGLLNALVIVVGLALVRRYGWPEWLLPME